MKRLSHHRMGPAFHIFSVMALTAASLRAAGPASSSAPAGGATQPAVPQIRCASPQVTLRGVWAGDKVEHRFAISNAGGAELKIINIEAACGCLVAEDYPRTLAPAARGEIRVSLQTARGSREVHKEMQVLTNDPAQPVQKLVLAGPLTPRIEVDPVFGANWGRLYPGASLTRVVKLTNHFTQPMKLEFAPDDVHTDYAATLKEVEPGKRAELTVRAKAGLAEGSHMQFVKLRTGFDAEPELLVPCTLFVPPVLEVTPVGFSVFQTASDVDMQTLAIRWNGATPMKVERLEVSDAAVKTELSEKEKGRLYTVVLTMPSGTSMAGTVEVTLRTDLKDRPEIKFPVTPRVLPVARSAPAQ